LGFERILKQITHICKYPSCWNPNGRAIDQNALHTKTSITSIRIRKSWSKPPNTVRKCV